MEYQINTQYPRSEYENIAQWWQTHKQYDINEYEDYILIEEREDHGAPSIIADCKNLLYATDYVVLKIQEAEWTDPEEAEQLKVKYADILQQRREARIKIKELEPFLPEWWNK